MNKPSIPESLGHGCISLLDWSASIKDVKNVLGDPTSESNPKGDSDIPNILFYPCMDLYFTNSPNPILEEILIQVWQISKSKHKKYRADFGWIHQKLTLSKTIKKLKTLNLSHKMIFNSITNIYGVWVNDHVSFSASDQALKNGNFRITRLRFYKERLEINPDVVKVLESFG